jgi:hypothetical protein
MTVTVLNARKITALALMLHKQAMAKGTGPERLSRCGQMIQTDVAEEATMSCEGQG